MTRESRDYLEMSFRSIRLFADDGSFCPANLREIVDIALRDGIVDGNEKRVLQGILGRLQPQELTQELKAQLERLKAHLG